MHLIEEPGITDRPGVLETIATLFRNRDGDLESAPIAPGPGHSIS